MKSLEKSHTIYLFGIKIGIFGPTQTTKYLPDQQYDQIH